MLLYVTLNAHFFGSKINQVINKTFKGKKKKKVWHKTAPFVLHLYIGHMINTVISYATINKRKQNLVTFL